MTPKKYIPHPKTLEALINGSRLMVVKLSSEKIEIIKAMTKLHGTNTDKVLANSLDLTQDDEIYIAEEFIAPEDKPIVYKELQKLQIVKDTFSWQPASEMTAEQSRLHFTIGEVSVKKIDELTFKEDIGVKPFNVLGSLELWLKAQNIEPTDYVALCELIEKE